MKLVKVDGTPSITTITSHKKKDSILKWRKRVGEEKANKISSQASNRGNKFHGMVECYWRTKVYLKMKRILLLLIFLGLPLRRWIGSTNIHLLELLSSVIIFALLVVLTA